MKKVGLSLKSNTCHIIPVEFVLGCSSSDTVATPSRHQLQQPIDLLSGTTLYVVCAMYVRVCRVCVRVRARVRFCSFVCEFGKVQCSCGVSLWHGTFAAAVFQK